MVGGRGNTRCGLWGATMAYRYYIDDDDKGDGYWIKVLLVGAVAGALVVGLAWAATWWLASPDPGPQQAASPQALHQPAVEGSEPDEATNDLERCRTVDDAQTAPLRAAADSLAQWEVHIGAMNKLVVGAISLRQARQFWNQTRVGAHAKLHEFAASRADYDRRIYHCAAPGPQAQPALEECHRAVVARGRTLRRASVALATWEEHVHHMDMLRKGEMTPQQATDLWLQSWRQGMRQVESYQAAARAGRGLTC